jgi:hypothetical protein
VHEDGGENRRVGNEGEDLHGAAATTLRAVPGQRSGRTS